MKIANPDEFGVFLGLASWLLSMSKEHKHLPFSYLDDTVLPAILLKQFKMIRKEGAPIAFISWASVTEDIASKFEAGEKKALELHEWRSGPRVIIVECISPFAPTALIKDHFIKELAQSA